MNISYWCGVIDTLTGNIVATSKHRTKHRHSANMLARDLNRANAGPDYGYIGGFVNGHTYYRFRAFCFTHHSYFHVTHPSILKDLKGFNSGFLEVAKAAKETLTREARLATQTALEAERDHINSFDIPQEYKDILLESIERGY